MNNCVLPVVVSESFLADLFAAIRENPQTTVTINLEKQTIVNNANKAMETFDINPYKKNCLLNGFDDIDYLLSQKDKIEAWEKNKI